MIILNTVKDELGCFLRFLVVQTKRLSRTIYTVFTIYKEEAHQDIRCESHFSSQFRWKKSREGIGNGSERDS